MVVCSECRREVHQDGPVHYIKPGSMSASYPVRGWRHCDDKSERCAGAVSTYPRARADVSGRACYADGPLPA
jgi:hypothetical protein